MADNAIRKKIQDNFNLSALRHIPAKDLIEQLSKHEATNQDKKRTLFYKQQTERLKKERESQNEDGDIWFLYDPNRGDAIATNSTVSKIFSLLLNGIADDIPASGQNISLNTAPANTAPTQAAQPAQRTATILNFKVLAAGKTGAPGATVPASATVKPTAQEQPAAPVTASKKAVEEGADPDKAKFWKEIKKESGYDHTVFQGKKLTNEELLNTPPDSELGKSYIRAAKHVYMMVNEAEPPAEWNTDPKRAIQFGLDFMNTYNNNTVEMARLSIINANGTQTQNDAFKYLKDMDEHIDNDNLTFGFWYGLKGTLWSGYEGSGGGHTAANLANLGLNVTGLGAFAAKFAGKQAIKKVAEQAFKSKLKEKVETKLTKDGFKNLGSTIGKDAAQIAAEKAAHHAASSAFKASAKSSAKWAAGRHVAGTSAVIAGAEGVIYGGVHSVGRQNIDFEAGAQFLPVNLGTLTYDMGMGGLAGGVIGGAGSVAAPALGRWAKSVDLGSKWPVRWAMKPLDWTYNQLEKKTVTVGSTIKGIADPVLRFIPGNWGSTQKMGAAGKTASGVDMPRYTPTKDKTKQFARWNFISEDLFAYENIPKLFYDPRHYKKIYDKWAPYIAYTINSRPNTRPILDFADKRMVDLGVNDAIRQLDKDILRAIETGGDAKKIINDFAQDQTNINNLNTFRQDIQDLRAHVKKTYGDVVKKDGTIDTLDESTSKTGLSTEQKNALLAKLDEMAHMAEDLLKGDQGYNGKQILENIKRGLQPDDIRNSVTGMSNANFIANNSYIRHTGNWPPGITDPNGNNKAGAQWIEREEKNIDVGYTEFNSQKPWEAYGFTKGTEPAPQNTAPQPQPQSQPQPGGLKGFFNRLWNGRQNTTPPPQNPPPLQNTNAGASDNLVPVPQHKIIRYIEGDNGGITHENLEKTWQNQLFEPYLKRDKDGNIELDVRKLVQTPKDVVGLLIQFEKLGYGGYATYVIQQMRRMTQGWGEGDKSIMASGSTFKNNFMEFQKNDPTLDNPNFNKWRDRIISIMQDSGPGSGAEGIFQKIRKQNSRQNRHMAANAMYTIRMGEDWRTTAEVGLPKRIYNENRFKWQPLWMFGNWLRGAYNVEVPTTKKFGIMQRDYGGKEPLTTWHNKKEGETPGTWDYAKLGLRSATRIGSIGLINDPLSISRFFSAPGKAVAAWSIYAPLAMAWNGEDNFVSDSFEFARDNTLLLWAGAGNFATIPVRKSLDNSGHHWAAQHAHYNYLPDLLIGVDNEEEARELLNEHEDGAYANHLLPDTKEAAIWWMVEHNSRDVEEAVREGPKEYKAHLEKEAKEAAKTAAQGETLTSAQKQAAQQQTSGKNDTSNKTSPAEKKKKSPPLQESASESAGHLAGDFGKFVGDGFDWMDSRTKDRIGNTLGGIGSWIGNTFSDLKNDRVSGGRSLLAFLTAGILSFVGGGMIKKWAGGGFIGSILFALTLVLGLGYGTGFAKRAYAGQVGGDHAPDEASKSKNTTKQKHDGGKVEKPKTPMEPKPFAQTKDGKDICITDDDMDGRFAAQICSKDGDPAIAFKVITQTPSQIELDKMKADGRLMSEKALKAFGLETKDKWEAEIIHTDTDYKNVIRLRPANAAANDDTHDIVLDIAG